MAIKYSYSSYGHDVNHINLIFVIQSYHLCFTCSTDPVLLGGLDIRR